MFRADVLRVFIASPGDLGQDRDEVEACIHEWNRQHASARRVVLLPQRWEGAAARQGGDGQKQINEQQVKDSDVVLAMFHTRLGRPTERAVSGTAEEIELGERFNKPTHVLVSRRRVDVREIDNDEFGRLQSYLRDVQKRGLTKDFADSSELRHEVNNALWLAVNEHLDKRPERDDATLAQASAVAITSGPFYASSLGALKAAIPDYTSDAEDLDSIIRALTAFADLLARVTEPARRMLALLVTDGRAVEGGGVGLSVLRLGRLLDVTTHEVTDLAAELTGYGLAYMDADKGVPDLVLSRQPANLDWEFWDDLLQLEAAAAGTVTRLIVHLRFDVLDSPASASTADGGPAHDRPSAPNVRWSLVRKGRSTFVLRNVGTATATNVHVSTEPATELARDLPAGVNLRPNASAQFTLFASMDSPMPNEIVVSSEGFEDEPQIVPLPS